MNAKALAVVAVIVVVVVALAAVVATSGDDDNEGVIYHGNGGVLSDGGDTYRSESNTVMTELFVLENKTLREWNTKADGTGTSYAVGDSITYDKSIDLYAQWGWTLSYNGDFGVFSGLSYFMLDGTTPVKISKSSMALPDSGISSVLIEGGSNWTLEDSTFVGTISGKTVRQAVTIQGASASDLRIEQDTPIISFTYDGPVSVIISAMISN